MSQSARLCIRGEHALPQWEPLERALVAGRGGEENGSSCAIPLRGVGPSINFPLITSPCPHVVALLKSLLSRAPKLFNCVARYLLSFFLPSSFLSLVRRFREERALLIVGSSFFPGRGHREERSEGRVKSSDEPTRLTACFSPVQPSLGHDSLLFPSFLFSFFFLFIFFLRFLSPSPFALRFPRRRFFVARWKIWIVSLCNLVVGDKCVTFLTEKLN